METHAAESGSSDSRTHPSTLSRPEKGISEKQKLCPWRGQQLPIPIFSPPDQSSTEAQSKQQWKKVGGRGYKAVCWLQRPTEDDDLNKTTSILCQT
jgi:hypothetical protein